MCDEFKTTICRILNSRFLFWFYSTQFSFWHEKPDEATVNYCSAPNSRQAKLALIGKHVDDHLATNGDIVLSTSIE